MGDEKDVSREVGRQVGSRPEGLITGFYFIGFHVAISNAATTHNFNTM